METNNKALMMRALLCLISQCQEFQQPIQGDEHNPRRREIVLLTRYQDINAQSQDKPYV